MTRALTTLVLALLVGCEAKTVLDIPVNEWRCTETGVVTETYASGGRPAVTRQRQVLGCRQWTRFAP